MQVPYKATYLRLHFVSLEQYQELFPTLEKSCPYDITHRV
jgi:hypothetical protein